MNPLKYQIHNLLGIGALCTEKYPHFNVAYSLCEFINLLIRSSADRHPFSMPKISIQDLRSQL